MFKHNYEINIKGKRKDEAFTLGATVYIWRWQLQSTIEKAKEKAVELMGKHQITELTVKRID